MKKQAQQGDIKWRKPTARSLKVLGEYDSALVKCGKHTMKAAYDSIIGHDASGRAFPCKVWMSDGAEYRSPIETKNNRVTGWIPWPDGDSDD